MINYFLLLRPVLFFSLSLQSWRNYGMNFFSVSFFDQKTSIKLSSSYSQFIIRIIFVNVKWCLQVFDMAVPSFTTVVQNYKCRWDKKWVDLLIYRFTATFTFASRFVTSRLTLWSLTQRQCQCFVWPFSFIAPPIADATTIIKLKVNPFAAK